MLSESIQKELSFVTDSLNVAKERFNKKILNVKTPQDILKQYMDIQSSIYSYKGKKRKTMHREIGRLENIHRHLKADTIKIDEKNQLENKVQQLEKRVQPRRSPPRSALPPDRRTVDPTSALRARHPPIVRHSQS